MAIMDRHLFPLVTSFLLLMLAMKALRGHATNTEPNKRPYIIYMGEKPRELVGLPQLAHSNLLQKAIGLSNQEASNRLIHSYTKSFHGFAAMLSDDEARKLSDMKELVSVFPSKQRRLHTTRSWDFMGFPSTVPRGPFESDVIIGMFDTGIWPESKSFDDAGFGPPPSKWKGICQSNHNFTCNNKIIGARYYHLEGKISEWEIPSPRDSEGHGTHTSSIAVGSLVTNVSLADITGGTARGGVPSARIAIYKVCWSYACSDIDLLAAFEDAIQDGVDIISISIGGYSNDYFEDPIAIGSFHAMKNNILTSTSAGNLGPYNFNVENNAPWQLTVAASTIDRKIVARTKIGNGEEVQGTALNFDGLQGEMYPLIYSKNAPNISADDYEENSRYCFRGMLDAELVKGKIVLCDSLTDDMSGPLLAGAVGAIIDSKWARDYSSQAYLPISMMDSKNFIQVLNYTNNTSNPTASIYKSEGIFDAKAPYVLSFSAHGPNPVTPNILKPDLTAPGVDILAAWSPLSDPNKPYNIISGTSVACPHATGVAAYVKSFNPTWSPAAIKSALITTAYVMSSTENEDAELAYGAGHINPLAALNPGLVYDAQQIDYIKMLCGEGYITTILRLITGDQSSCSSKNNGTVLDLNYPTFALQTQHGKSFSASFQRTVTNVGVSNSTYYAIVDAPSNLKIKVEPNVLSFEALLEKKSFLVKLDGVAYETILSGVLIWSDGIHNVRSPIVVYTLQNYI